ncbi:MAG TPA: Yip1 family protein [Ktedonosporobacter sp.]|nr:Yip1 family protein [Ktedonosporobacter sp.]
MSYDPNVPPVPPVPPTGPEAALPYQAPPTETHPLPVGEAIRQLPAKYWQAVSKPGAGFYAEEKGRAAWDITWVQIAFLAILSAIFTIIIYNLVVPAMIADFVLPSIRSNPSIPPERLALIQQQITASIQASSISSSLSNLISVPLGLFIGVGILHLIAKAFRGTGTFVQYMYGYLLFGVPLSVAGYILALIPILGWFLAGVLGIYHVVLTIFMTMGVHRLSGGKATLVVLLPFIVVLALSCIIFFIVVAAIAGSMHR